ETQKTFQQFCVLAAAAAAQDRPQPTKLTAAQQQRLRERDRLYEAATDLSRRGKLAEAIATGEQMLAIERAAYGNYHDEGPASPPFLAELHVFRGDLARAGQARREALAVKAKLYGEKHWQTAEARYHVNFVARLSRLSPEQRRRLWKAQDLKF